MLFASLLIFLGITHFTFTSIFFLGLFKSGNNPGMRKDKLKISILVPARNEETLIEKCIISLLNQDYPQHLTQFVFIDDGSTDATWRILSDYANKFDNVSALRSPGRQKGMPLSPKKRAMLHGINNSTGDLILACDADCTAPETWAGSMVSCFEENVVMVAGYAGIDRPGDKQPLFIKLQALELLSMFTCAAGSLMSAWPLASSGSNQAFRRREFLLYGGYGSTGDVLSGDDDLLLQRLTRLSKKKAVFSNDPKSYMYTEPMPDFASFFNQRKRWGAKYTHYKMSYKLFLTQYYLLTAFVFALLLASIVNSGLLPFALTGLVIKLLPEYILVLKGTSYFRRTDLRKYLPLWSFFQIPYITIIGALSLFTRTTWKGRRFNTRSRID